MKTCGISIVVLSVCLAAAWPAHARDIKHLLPIKDPQAKLNGSIKVFFGKQATPHPIKYVRTEVVSAKANIIKNSVEQACNFAFSDALTVLEKAG